MNPSLQGDTQLWVFSSMPWPLSVCFLDQQHLYPLGACRKFRTLSFPVESVPSRSLVWLLHPCSRICFSLSCLRRPSELLSALWLCALCFPLARIGPPAAPGFGLSFQLQSPPSSRMASLSVSHSALTHPRPRTSLQGL